MVVYGVFIPSSHQASLWGKHLLSTRLWSLPLAWPLLQGRLLQLLLTNELHSCFHWCLKISIAGAPGWLSPLSIWLLISAQVLTSGSWDLHTVWSLPKKWIKIPIAAAPLKADSQHPQLPSPFLPQGTHISGHLQTTQKARKIQGSFRLLPLATENRSTGWTSGMEGGQGLLRGCKKEEPWHVLSSFKLCSSLLFPTLLWV